MNPFHHMRLSPVLMGLLMSVGIASGAMAGLACFDGPHFDHQEKDYAYWTYTNGCNGAVTIAYQIETDDGQTETGTARVKACEDGSLIDLKGKYKFDILASDQGKYLTCDAKRDGVETGSASGLSGQNATNPNEKRTSRHPDAAADGVADTEEAAPDADGPMREDFAPAGVPRAGQKSYELQVSRLGDVAGSDRCWRQTARGAARLICCGSDVLCVRTCTQMIGMSASKSCGAACTGAAEHAPSALNCYWLH